MSSKMRIYESGNMINFDNDDGTKKYFDEPKGSLSLSIVGSNRFQFFSKARNQNLTIPLFYNEIGDSAGITYGPNFDAVRIALNNLLGNFFFDITSDDVTNESTVAGTTVTDALDNLDADKLQWQTASIQSTGITNVFILTLLAIDYAPNTAVNIWGKVWAKEPGTNNFYAGTFTAVTNVNNLGVFVSVTGTVQQTVEDNFPVNPVFTKGIQLNNFQLRCNSGVAGIIIDWEINYLLDVKLMP